MKVVAAIEADFSQGPLGTRSRLREDLLGESVVRQALRRVLAARRVASVHLCVDVAQADLAREVARGLEVAVETHDGGPTPWRSRIASARKWSLDAWRGGLGGATVFDEAVHPWVLHALVQRERAEGAVCVPPAAPLLDPQLLDRMIEHYEKVRQDMRMVFTQSAPGLSAAVYMPSMLEDLVHTGHPPGMAMAYHPDAPAKDMVMQSCFYAGDSVVMHATGRCIADTQRAVERIRAILSEHRPDSRIPDAAAVSRWLMDHRWCDVGSLPAEVEIELTTDDPLPDSTLRPRGPAVPSRGPLADATFDRLIEELAARDDVRVVLGGFGDPLLHPRWSRCVERCRRAGIFALAVRTPAVHLDDQAVKVLIDHQVDVLNVLLDAATAGTYQRVHRADHFDRVIANIDRVFAAQREARQPQPLVVCEMVKTHATMDELEPFYDHWVRKTGSAVLAGPSTYAGQWPDLAVINMAPPTRGPCGRVFDRIIVLADGRVTPCDQDVRGYLAIGSLEQASLADLWTGSAMSALRRSHLGATYDALPLCRTCNEWHRP